MNHFVIVSNMLSGERIKAQLASCSFLNLFIELCFEINQRIILSKPKRARNSEEFFYSILKTAQGSPVSYNGHYFVFITVTGSSTSVSISLR